MASEVDKWGWRESYKYISVIGGGYSVGSLIHMWRMWGKQWNKLTFIRVG